MTDDRRKLGADAGEVLASYQRTIAVLAATLHRHKLLDGRVIAEQCVSDVTDTEFGQRVGGHLRNAILIAIHAQGPRARLSRR